MNDKAGYKTTEFWFAIVAQIIALLIAAGVVGADDATRLQGSAEAVAVLLANLAPFALYIWSRTRVKTNSDPLAAILEDIISQDSD